MLSGAGGAGGVRGRDCGIGEEGWDAVLRGTARAAVTSLARLRARPADERWRMHRPAMHKDPLEFSDCIDTGWRCCVGKDGCLRDYRESRMGFRPTSKGGFNACMACAAADDPSE